MNNFDPPTTSTRPNGAGGNRHAKATNTTARSVLTAGAVYDATLIRKDTGGTYTVSIPDFGELNGCIYATGLVANMIGIQTSCILTAGLSVKVATTNPPCLFACTDVSMPDFVVGSVQGVSGRSEFDRNNFIPEDEAGTAPRSVYGPDNTSTDAFEGELEVSNLMGTALRLLFGLSQLSAGSRAKIECLASNEMVRILSATFKHHSAFGDFCIGDNGRVDYRVDGSSYDHEVLGKENADDPLGGMNGDIPDLDAEDLDSILNATGRWRFSLFTGFLGDFMHTFFTDPMAAVGRISADSPFRSGKANVHVNGDGSILVQSVGEIALERTVRIVVPREKKRWDTDLKTHLDRISKMDKTLLKRWNYGDDTLDKAWMSVYQLRDYARWLSQYSSLVRFRQMPDYWDVPLESEVPEPDWNGHEEDKKSANTGAPSHYDVYATIRIMRDGSIVLWSGCGCSVELVDGDVQISATRNLHLSAAADIVLTATNVYVKAQRSIELASIVGGLSIKCRTWLKALCERGSVWFKSDMDSAAPYTPDEGNPDALDVGHGVLLDAPSASVLVNGEKGATLLSTQGDAGLTSLEGSLKLGGANGIVLSSAEALLCRVKEFGVKSEKVVFRASRYVAMGKKFVYWISRAKDEGSNTPALQEELHINKLSTQHVKSARSIKGPDVTPLQVSDDTPLRGVLPHLNHIQKFKDGEFHDTVDADMSDLSTQLDAINTAPQINLKPKANLLFTLRDNQPMGYGSDSKRSEPAQSLAQQMLSSDTSNPAIVSWDWSNEALLAGKRTDTASRPYPGVAEPTHLVYVDGVQPPLNVPSGIAPTNQATDLKSTTYVFRRRQS